MIGDSNASSSDSNLRAREVAPTLCVDVVIVAYRSEAVIGPCIASLQKDQAVAHLIVVNNSPGDVVSDQIRNIPEVGLIETNRNIGFGPAVNLARSHLTAPFIAIVNPDTIQRDNTLGQLARFLQGHAEAGLVSPRVFDSGGRHCYSSEREVNVIRLLLDSLRAPPGLGTRRSAWAHRRAHRTQNLNGAFLVARKEALDNIDWFDESIFLFGEDQDVCRRMRAMGWQIWFVPVGHVVHEGGHSWRHLGSDAWKAQRDARAEQLLRAHGHRQAVLFRWLGAVKDAVLGAS